MKETAHPPRSYTYRLVDGYLLTVNASIPPYREEWDAMIACMMQLTSPLKGTLVYTHGGAPSATQRKQFRDAYQHKGSSSPIAILIGSGIVRDAITALNLFLDHRLKGFAPDKIDEALRYLNVPQEKWALLKQNHEEMKRELGIPRPGSEDQGDG